MTGLITINDNNNIGNRLQNFASFKLLSKYDKTFNIVRRYGCEYKRFPDRKNYYIAKIYHKFLNFISKIFHPRKALRKFRRSRNFSKFNSNILSSEVLRYNTNYTALNLKYDRFFVGSDQVWNPNVPGNGLFINMLGFVTDSKKKNSISASISQNILTDEQNCLFKKYLSDFANISCREQQGSDLIKNIVDKDVVTLVDPTLMLTSSEWDVVAKKPRYKVPNDFILVYVLGNLTTEYKKIIEYYSKIYHTTVINILDECSPFYETGPSEFLWLIKKCSMVITDSFHGTAFSCIYGKNVKILERSGGSDMNSRLINIKNILCINDDSFVDISNYKSTALETTFSAENLNKEKDIFDLFLKKAFKE